MLRLFFTIHALKVLKRHRHEEGTLVNISAIQGPGDFLFQKLNIVSYSPTMFSFYCTVNLAPSQAETCPYFCDFDDALVIYVCLATEPDFSGAHRLCAYFAATWLPWRSYRRCTGESSEFKLFLFHFPVYSHRVKEVRSSPRFCTLQPAM